MRALVIGSAACMHEDVLAAKALFQPDIVVAANLAGIYFHGHIDHWATCHVDDFPAWILKREQLGYERVEGYWTNDTKIGVIDPKLDHLNIRGAYYWGGTSGQLAISVAQTLGAEKIVLAGIPLTDGPHCYDDNSFDAHDFYRPRWLFHAETFGDKVRSCSGWTRKLLGAPTEEWLCPTISGSAPNN